MACAWATFFCYGTMMVLSFVWGQKHYYIPYAWKKLAAFMTIAVMLYFIHRFLVYLNGNYIFNIICGIILVSLYIWFILKIEKKEFQKLPYIGKYI
jgi:hypothetical protein